MIRFSKQLSLMITIEVLLLVILYITPPIFLSAYDVTSTPALPRPTSELIAFISDRDGYPTVYVMSPDGSSQRSILPSESSAYASNPVWTLNGEQLVFSVHYDDNRNSRIYIYKFGDLKQQFFIISGSTIPANPVWSPNAENIAFVSNQDNYWQIYTMKNDGSNLRRLTDQTANDYNPVWSPDGKLIAYIRGNSGDAQLRIMNSDGSNSQDLATTIPFDHPTWSPDSRRIAFVSDYESKRQICIFDLVDKSKRCPTQLTEVSSPQWSTDGNYIVLSARSGVSYDIHILELSTNKSFILTNGKSRNITPVWSPDSKHIAFVSDQDGGINNVFVVDVNGTNLRDLTNNKGKDSNTKPSWKPR